MTKKVVSFPEKSDLMSLEIKRNVIKSYRFVLGCKILLLVLFAYTRYVLVAKF